MNNRVAEKIEELMQEKALIKQVIGKDKALTVDDFERYIKIKYNAKIYNSIGDFYKQVYDKDIGDDYEDYVDCLAYPIVNTTHKIFIVTNPTNKSKNNNSSMVLYSYQDKHILDIFIHSAGVIENSGCFFLFIKDGMAKSIKAIKQYYGMSEKEAEKLLQQLL